MDVQLIVCMRLLSMSVIGPKVNRDAIGCLAAFAAGVAQSSLTRGLRAGAELQTAAGLAKTFTLVDI